jgi:cytochrome c biogenesis factor
LLFLGIIGSGRYGEKQTASLTLQEPKEVLGHTLTYEGTQRTPDGTWKYVVRVEKEGTQFVLEPVMFDSDYNNSVMRNPDYASSLTGDFYLEPVSLEQAEAQDVAHELVRLKKGEPQTIGDIQMTFVRFDMSHEPKGNMLAGSEFAVGAVLEVKRGKDVEVVIPVTMYQGTHPPEPRAARTKDGTLGFELLAMNVDAATKTSAVELNVAGLRGADAASRRVEETLVVEASVKPFIGLIWAAALLVIVGLLLSLRSKTGGPPKGDRGEKRPAVADQLTQRAKKKSNGEQVEEPAKGM